MAGRPPGCPSIEDRAAPLELMRQVQIVGGASSYWRAWRSASSSTPAFFVLAAFVGAGLTLRRRDGMVRHGEAAGVHALEPARRRPEPMDALWTYVSAGLSGALVALLLALFGGGGSVLATPLLLYVVGVREPHVAIGTSAAAVAVNAAMVSRGPGPRRPCKMALCAGVRRRGPRRAR